MKIRAVINFVGIRLDFVVLFPELISPFDNRPLQGPNRNRFAELTIGGNWILKFRQMLYDLP